MCMSVQHPWPYTINVYSKHTGVRQERKIRICIQLIVLIFPPFLFLDWDYINADCRNTEIKKNTAGLSEAPTTEQICTSVADGSPW